MKKQIELKKKRELEEQKKQIGFKRVEFDDSCYNSLARKLNNVIDWGIRRNPNSLRFMYWDDVVDEYRQNKMIVEAIELSYRELDKWEEETYQLAIDKLNIYSSYFKLIELLELDTEKEYKGLVEWVREPVS